MKIKLSWIPFVPLVFIAVLLRIYQVLFIDSNINTTLASSNTMTLIFGGCIALLFILVGIFSFSDKKTSSLYSVGKNFLAGIFAIITGAIICFDAALMFLNCTSTGIIDVPTIINSCVSVFGAIIFIFAGLVSVTGKNFLKKTPALMLILPIWSCVRLIITFASYTTIAVASKDVTDLIYMVFTTLFLFNLSAVYVGIDGKKSVKACFLYGMPAIASILAYNVALITRQITAGGSFDFLANLQCFEYLAMAMFMIFFLIELTSRATEKGKEDATQNTVLDTVLPSVNKEPVKNIVTENTSSVELSDSIRESLTDKKYEKSEADKLVDEILNGSASNYLQDDNLNEDNTLNKTTEFTKGSTVNQQPDDIFKNTTADNHDYIGYYDREKLEKRKSSEVSNYGDRIDDIDKLIIEITTNGKKK